MELTDAVRVDLAPAAVAQALSDLALVRASLENCETFTRLPDGEFALTFTVPVGPLRGRYEVRLHLADVEDSPEREPARVLHRVINFKAGAAGVGSLRGQLEIALEPAGSGDAAQTTRIDYAIWTTLTGPLAALPPGQIENALQALAEDFFAEFAAVVEAKHGKRPNRAAPAGWSRRQHVFLRPINLAGLVHRSPHVDAPSPASGRLSGLLLGARGSHGLERREPRAMPPWAWALAIVIVGALLYLLHRLQ
jgi:carbon monoxide dehydrogenase subunit G